MIQQYRGLSIRPVDSTSLSKYLELFKASFPDYKTSIEYLNWLYFQNPNGCVVGYDAYDGESLIAHYVCVPIWIDVYEKPSLLALNTATHPKYQGRGLLKVLANNTYEKYENHFACVVGVANAQAIKPLTKHLGFEHMGDLELRFGVLGLNGIGRRIYTEEEIVWRARCPGKPLNAKFCGGRIVRFTRHVYGILPITAFCPVREERLKTLKSKIILLKFGFTLDWRREQKPKIFLPKKFKPSPLSFVFRPLSESDSSRLAAWTFPDFDAL
jgi:GNAT superfamily N-acetyltransferase